MVLSSKHCLNFCIYQILLQILSINTLYKYKITCNMGLEISEIICRWFFDYSIFYLDSSRNTTSIHTHEFLSGYELRCYRTMQTGLVQMKDFRECYHWLGWLNKYVYHVMNLWSICFNDIILLNHFHCTLWIFA